MRTVMIKAPKGGSTSDDEKKKKQGQFMERIGQIKVGGLQTLGCKEKWQEVFAEGGGVEKREGAEGDTVGRASGFCRRDIHICGWGLKEDGKYVVNGGHGRQGRIILQRFFEIDE